MLSNQIMELPAHYLDDGPDTEATGIDADQATGDFAFFFGGGVAMEVLAAGVVVTEDFGGDTSEGEFKFDKRPTAGSDSDRGDGDIGAINCAGATAGQVIYDKSAEGTELVPGNEVMFEMTQRSEGTSSAGHVRPFLLVKYKPELPVNLDNMEATADLS